MMMLYRVTGDIMPCADGCNHCWYNCKTCKPAKRVDKFIMAKSETDAFSLVFGEEYLYFDDPIRDCKIERIESDLLMRYIGAPTLPGF